MAKADGRIRLVTSDGEPLGNAPSEAHIEFQFGGGGGPVDPTVSVKDYIDARDDAVESRLSAQLKTLPTKGTMWAVAASIIGAIFVGVTIIISVLAFGGDRFDGGVSVGPRLEAAQKQQAATDDQQNASIALMTDKLDVIIRQTAKK